MIVFGLKLEKLLRLTNKQTNKKDMNKEEKHAAPGKAHSFQMCDLINRNRMT